MVRACRTPRQPLQNHPSGHLGGWATSGCAEKLLDGQHQRVNIPAHAGTANKASCRKKWKWISSESSLMSPPLPRGTELNWTQGETSKRDHRVNSLHIVDFVHGCLIIIIGRRNLFGPHDADFVGFYVIVREKLVNLTLCNNSYVKCWQFGWLCVNYDWVKRCLSSTSCENNSISVLPTINVHRFNTTFVANTKFISVLRCCKTDEDIHYIYLPLIILLLSFLLFLFCKSYGCNLYVPHVRTVLI